MSSHLTDAMARFRAQQAKAAKVVAEGAKNREKHLAKQSSSASRSRTAASRAAASKPSTSGPALTEAQKFRTSTAAPLRGVVAVPKNKGKNTSILLKKVKDILEFLKSKDGPVTPQEIKASVKDMDGTGIDITAIDGLEEKLLASGRVAIVDGGAAYAFQAEFQVKNKKELLKLLRNNPNGLPMEDLRDAYRELEADVDALVADRDAYRIYSWDVQADVVFPADARSKVLLGTPLDADLTDLFREEQVPLDVDSLHAALKTAGITPAVRTAAHKRPMVSTKPKERKKRAGRQKVFTNTHMPELFQAAQPDKID